VVHIARRVGHGRLPAKIRGEPGTGAGMHHVLAGSQIRLTYLQDRRALRRIDWSTVFDDLTDAGTPMNQWHWCDLDGLTHVVLAIDRVTGRHAGVLGLTERATTLEPWLLVEFAMVRPKESDTLARAMLAHVLARIVCLDGKPAAIAAARANQTALRDLGLNIRSAALHPPAEGNVIGFRVARLARQIGGGRMVLDLRPVAEMSLLRDLRGLHGVRPERRTLPADQELMEKPARSGGATRRPRNTTRTGRSG
jgi:hypothetical protein